MPKKTVITFNCIGLLFGLNMLFFWHKLFIGLPIISAYLTFYFVFDFFPELFSCFCSSCANFTIDEFVPISINSNPDPTIVFFEPIYVCISSISTISISSLLRNSSSFSPNDFIQLKTVTWLTFKNLPIERNPNLKNS